MSKEPRFLKCYISAIEQTVADPFLAERQFATGVVVFAIPDYGILFRCRAAGSPVDLEFGAYFALLRFIKTRLEGEKIKAIQTLSSNPEFVFAFTGKSRHLKSDDERARLLREFSRDFTLAVGYVPTLDNKALLPSSELPSLPRDAHIHLAPEPSGERKPTIKPFHRGVDL